MANLRDISRRIKSVKNTSQITKAMQLVASAKMKKAQDQAMHGRSYIRALGKVLSRLEDHLSNSAHPLMQEQKAERELCLVISSDKGLCGPLNTNLLKKMRAELGDNVTYVTIGRKLRTQLAKTGAELIADFHIADPVPVAASAPVTKLLREQFLSGQFSKVSIAYTGFVNTLVQNPLIRTILPLDGEQLRSLGEDDLETSSSEFTLEPSPDAVLESILPLFLNYAVYQLILEARASEHSARMVAMKSASDNAKELIADLTLDYNKLRQADITTELLEMSTAMAAME